MPENKKLPEPEPMPVATGVANGRPDPWANRSAGMRCVSCCYYVEKKGSSRRVLGRCRRNAPTMSGYPVVFPDDWCGEHKLSENA